MILFINKLIGSVMQILLFALIPFIWWFVTERKKQSFFNWIGLERIPGAKKSKTFLWIAGVTAAFISSSVLTLWLLRNVETATSEFSGLGMKAIPAVLVYAIFNTSFPEELLFRGFILKRIAAKCSFSVANIVQSLLFGLIHGLMFFSLVGVMKALAIILFTGAVAWFIGYINEKKADGSILPGWIMHAIANVFSGICSAFLLL